MQALLPVDHNDAVLLGRIETADGPTPVLLRDGAIEDMSAIAPTVADLLNGLAPGSMPPSGKTIGSIDALAFRGDWEGGMTPRLLSPVDLQCIKASGVTFAVSAIERVIEERARGDLIEADRIRADIAQRIGTDIRTVRPGSDEASRLKTLLIADGLWSQYLEVAIGPDAEIFTKAPVLSTVGAGADIGVRADSEWNNPEPEVVIVCDAAGQARGATLGNDVNLRDIEGRSALLLGKAKDNNASCSIGPFIRLFDDRYTLDDLRSAVVTLEIEGADGFRLDGSSSMAMISRDPLDLVGQTIGKNHQFPDGFVLFLGTMFAPTDDRGTAGRGFTHQRGDIVRIATPRLGTLVNRVVTCEEAAPWTFGVSALMRNLARRGLLPA
ncbi:fumarylacetoacetate hydrolase family protein [Sphingomonas quercus]|uniref:Fumarylacetoacetate hydrolase family protein n=1 Tax=Sphingomonas quercus TaxID=2842451 RepID=A0ABS6BLV3_9SPHN|nr:fumarylacetoacetate hydrolase family protein [Sphingomonas quercus]MBU3078592.1 fumarylacetoacetate hydrolase family protein [Sphingomonas quercus]